MAHRHEVVQPRDVAERVPRAGVLVEEGLGHRQRLGDAGALDEHVVEPPLECEGSELREEVLAKGAADAAVAQLHHTLAASGCNPALGIFRPPPDECCVDVNFRHVVHLGECMAT
jgi:hypothetical protein